MNKPPVEQTSPYTREVKFEAAYDKRDPNPSKNYGVHGLHIWFTLRHAPTGTGLVFSVSTSWQLPSVDTSSWHRSIKGPTAFGVDYHDTKPHYEGQRCHEPCHITGGKCYSDGSGLLGDEFLQTLIAEGDEGLWKRMEQQHKEWCL